MRRFTLWLLIALLLAGCAANEAAAVGEGGREACPVTIATGSFTPPAPYPAQPPGEQGWYGSPALWTTLPVDSQWAGLPRSDDGYSQKLFFWSEGYDAGAEPEPALVVSARRLDGAAARPVSAGATHASADSIGSAMLAGLELPTAGCWEITGQYDEAALRYVVWISP